MLVLSLLALLLGGTTPAQADSYNPEDLYLANAIRASSRAKPGPLHILVVKHQQLMWVYENGQIIANWRVATGTEAKKCSPNGECYLASTPVGWFKPDKMYERGLVKRWNAVLSYIILFDGEFAIHASGNLTPRSSGGCVRLDKKNAKTLFDLVQQYGIENTTIQIYE